MRSVGLDTSVVLRLLTEDPKDQANLAKKKLDVAFKSKKTVFISDLVISEVYFGLQHHYGVPKSAAKKALIQLLESKKVNPEKNGKALLALKEDEKSGGAGLVDRMIVLQNLDSTHETLTFDKKMAKVSGCIHVSKYEGK
jgi:predicted nucleic-acid-binding protein